MSRALALVAALTVWQVASTWAGEPATDGAELLAEYCTACHSLKIVTQQRLNRPVWDDVLNWMVEEQAMPELEEDTRTAILNYLAATYGPATPR